MFLRSVLAAVIAVLIVAGTETVAGYPRPSSASGAFFAAALITYLPIFALAAWFLSLALPRRGLDLWFPLLAGAFRVTLGLLPEVVANVWTLLPLSLGAVIIVFTLRRLADVTKGSPPYLFGLTVGMVLPILVARVAMGMSALGAGPQGRALALGALFGMLGFVILRGLVSTWPRLAPAFLLGPLVGLGGWNRNAAPPPTVPPPGEVRELKAVRPDIVLIVLDTVRAQALESYGHSWNTMPNLEAFAHGATVFRRAWTNGSWTLPGHASLFSGLRLTRHGYDSGFLVPERTPPDRFLAARLRGAGYATGAVSANFGVGREDPLLHGFESIDAEPLRPYAFRPWLFDLIAWFPGSLWLSRQAAQFPGPSMRAPWVVDRGLRFWARSAGKPRFLFVNLMEAHLPWIPEPMDLGRFGPLGLDAESEQVEVLGRYLKNGRPTPKETTTLRARYDESLYSLDRSLARLLDGVTKGLRNEGTIVVVTSDHGESLGEHDRFGHRNSLDEEATRIPLIVRGPGLEAGERRDTPVQLVDVFGYLARSAGLPVEPDLDARPLGERRHVVIEHRPGLQGTLPATYPRGDLSALVEWPFKYVEGSTVEASLFDLSADPGEQRNLVAREPARVEAMRLVLRDFSGSRSSGAPLPDRAADERLRALGYVR